jgi:hypothetical protein
VVRAVEPLFQLAVLADAEHGGRDAVHGHDVTLRCDGQAGDYVNVANGDFLEIEKKKENKFYCAI